MACVIFRTPGLLDLRSVTTFGLHAKPKTDTPIGFFGTGLKYAIAVLVREGIPVRLLIGEAEYEFYRKDAHFRDKEFAIVMMRQRNSLLKRWKYTELPFTTQHGKKWELWQAFRELESNTRDEGGTTQYYHAVYFGDVPWEEGFTKWVIGGEKFPEVYHDRDKIFLPDGLTMREGDAAVQVFNRPSEYLYWRGMRVMDLEKPSQFTYNILAPMELTEDRTLKNIYAASMALGQFIATSKDKKMISNVLQTDPEKFFEGRIDFDYVWNAPSEEFLEVVAKRIKRNTPTLPRAFAYFDRYAPRVSAIDIETLPIQEQLQHWVERVDQPKLKRLLQRLQKCAITEPAEPTDDFPF